MQIREYFKKKKRRFFVLRELTKRERKHANSETKLGWLWEVLDPLLHVAIFSFLTTNWFLHDLENYPLFVMFGYYIYHFFQHATSGSITALVSNKNFLVQTKWKKKIFVQQRVYDALLNFTFACIPCAALMFFYQVKPGIKCLFLLPDMFLIVLLAFGAAEILAVVYVFFADIRYLYENFMVLLLFASGIFYPAEILPDTARLILEWNPVYLCVTIARNSIAFNRFSEPWLWIRLAVLAVFVYLLGGYVLSKNENAVMQKL